MENFKSNKQIILDAILIVAFAWALSVFVGEQLWGCAILQTIAIVLMIDALINNVRTKIYTEIIKEIKEHGQDSSIL